MLTNVTHTLLGLLLAINFEGNGRLEYQCARSAWSQLKAAGTPKKARSGQVVLSNEHAYLTDAVYLMIDSATGAPVKVDLRIIDLRTHETRQLADTTHAAIGFPVAASSYDHSLHVVWAEPNAAKYGGLNAPARRLTGLWHATYNWKRFSAPERIYVSDELAWGIGQNSKIAFSGSKAHIAFGSYRKESGWELVYGNYAGAHWKMERIQTVAPVVYADVAADASGRVALVYVTAGERGEENVLKLLVRDVRQAEWSEWVTGPAAHPAFEPRVGFDLSGLLHLVWLTHRGPNTEDAIWHMSWFSNGTLNERPSRSSANSTLYQLAFAVDACGVVHAAATSFGVAEPRLTYRMLERHIWRASGSFEGQRGALPSFAAGEGNIYFQYQQPVRSGQQLLLRPVFSSQRVGALSLRTSERGNE